ncbi:MAG TPA: hypothetical protein VF476_15145 [Chitinophagaceae bacterium]
MPNSKRNRRGKKENAAGNREDARKRENSPRNLTDNVSTEGATGNPRDSRTNWKRDKKED